MGVYYKSLHRLEVIPNMLLTRDGYQTEEEEEEKKNSSLCCLKGFNKKLDDYHVMLSSQRAACTVLYI